MKHYTGWQMLCIDVANNHYTGLDKLTFEPRIEWVEQNLDVLEAEAEGRSWKQRPMYIKAVSALRKAQQKIPTGHLVGFDAICSGLQIMSVLTCCLSGARATGLVDQDVRSDAYAKAAEIISSLLGFHTEGERNKIKLALMSAFYGSKKEPEKLYGKNTPELTAFHRAMYILGPGACQLLQLLVDSWRSNTLSHDIILPDGFDSRVKVMVRKEAKIEVDELDHATFQYMWYENDCEERGLKNAANTIHAVDGYVLRSLIRRCNYDRDHAEYASMCIENELLERNLGIVSQDMDFDTDKLSYYRNLFEQSGIADIVILPYLDQASVSALTDKHLRALNKVLETMLAHKPFEIVTVHDDFKCHANNVNYLRQHYNNILADLAESTTLDWLLSQLYQTPLHFPKLNPELPDIIRNANYALC